MNIATTMGRRAPAITLAVPRWGHLPLLSVSSVAGLLAVAAANIGARAGAPWAEVAFYGGLLLLFLPIGLRLLLDSPTRHERLALVVVLGLALFACKFLRDPIWWGGYDEFLHVRTANDLLLTGHLFAPNSLLDVSPFYPGMELMTTAFAQVSGLPLFTSAAVTLAATRLVFVLALFLFFERATGSPRLASVASLIYMTNPHFLYFNAQFAYETLALPLAALALFLVARRAWSSIAIWTGLTIIALVTIAAVVTTHHVTSLLLAAFLLAWGVVAVILGRREGHNARPGRIGVVTLVLIAGWTLIVATTTINYLGPVLSSTASELLRLAGGQLAAREVFASRAGDIAPLWERLVGSASAAVVLFLLPFGLYIVWQTGRSRSALVALALAASLYPLSLVARLTAVGAEVASRTPEFLFIPLAVMIGLVLVRFSYHARFGHMAAALGLIALLVVGGVLVGTPTWARLPGPYLVSADTRSVEPEGIAAAEWADQVLGPGNTMVADRVNRILMSSYGEQNMITTYATGLAVRSLYLSRVIQPSQREIVRAGQIRYLVADQRLATGLPVVGHYFDRGEEDVVGIRTTPLDPTLLSKFDRLPEVSRVFDSGNIQIYDISGLAGPP